MCSSVIRKSSAEHHTTGFMFDTVFSRRTGSSDGGSSSISITCNVCNRQRYLLPTRRFASSFVSLLAKPVTTITVKAHSHSFSITLLGLIHDVLALLSQSQLPSTFVFVCFRPRGQGWHHSSFQPCTLSGSARKVLLRKPNKTTSQVRRSKPSVLSERSTTV